MSEDLRYYFFNKEDDDNTSISADEGWGKMAALLDQEMPEKILFIKRRSVPYIISFAAIFVFLILTLPIKESNKKQPAKSTASAAVNRQNINIVPQPLYLKPFKHDASIIQNAASVDTRRASHQLIQNNYVTPGVNASLPVANIANDHLVKIDSSVSITLAQKDTLQALPAVSTSQQKIKLTPRKRWQLQAGAGINISTGGQQFLQPYPVFDAKYYFLPKLYISSGVAVFSPLATSGISGIEKTVYVNDTVNNVSMYNEKVIYKRLHYIDVPLLAGWQVNKNISVQGGVQISRLISSKSYNASEPYDFNMNRVSANVSDLVLMGALPPVKNDVHIREMDYRVLAGVEYKVNKLTSVNLQYQQGLRPVITGDQTSNKRNSLLTLKVKVRIN